MSRENLHHLLELFRNTADSTLMNVRSETHDDTLRAAIKRLDGAMSRVEGVTSQLRNRAEAAEKIAAQALEVDVDRARLAEALDAARGKEAVMQVAAQEASDTLERAIEDLRLVVDEE